MKKPKTVQILGVVYKIKYSKKNYVLMDGKKVPAYISFEKRCIYIANVTDWQMLLFHEIFHGVFEAVGLHLKDRQEETLAQLFARLMLEILRSIKLIE